jgi:hypothetical protein
MRVFDAHMWKGLTGLLLAVTSPYLDFLTVGIQVVAGLGGLVLLYLSIRHKLLQEKAEHLRIKELQAKLREHEKH